MANAMKCLAMVWRNEEFCYTPCRSAPQKGCQWCTTHMKTTSDGQRLIKLDEMKKERHWRLAIIAQRRIELIEQERARRREYLERVEAERLEKEALQKQVKDNAYWHCPNCSEKFCMWPMLAVSISDKQRVLITKLIRTRVLTSDQIENINSGLLLEDRAWAYRCIHRLMFHQEERPIDMWSTY